MFSWMFPDYLQWLCNFKYSDSGSYLLTVLKSKTKEMRSLGIADLTFACRINLHNRIETKTTENTR